MTSETIVSLQCEKSNTKHKQRKKKKKKGDFTVQGCAASFPETTKVIDLVGRELQDNMIYE